MPGTITVDINADYGPLILGGLLAFGLSGCVNMQFIVYWQIYSEERWTTKSLVIATWFLDICHSVFVAVAIWDSVIAPYGDLTKVNVIPWSVGPTVELTAMITFLVQRRAPSLANRYFLFLLTVIQTSFFAYRIYRLQGRKLTVAGPVFTLAFIRLVAASVSMAEMITLKCYSDFVRPFPSWVFTLGLSLSAFVDIVNTTFLCYFLRSNRSQVSSTNRIIDTLTVWTVQNGSITCLGTIATLVCWTAMPQNRIFLGLHFVVAKLYANSLLATYVPLLSKPLRTKRRRSPIHFIFFLFDSLNARRKIRRSRKRSSINEMLPITVLPDGVLRRDDEQDEPVSPRSRRPYVVRRRQLGTEAMMWIADVFLFPHLPLPPYYARTCVRCFLGTSTQTRLDPLRPQPVNLKRGLSSTTKIEVSVQQTVESKYDDEVEVDGLSATAESVREREEPRAI
ncbi:hypothetical protein J3R83DRAFT_6032 [Lanmaoa asiatica]|nr:hypothetical protein J3R83DRAFT_6032 [Lanmaoa asiatica]